MDKGDKSLNFAATTGSPMAKTPSLTEQFFRFANNFQSSISGKSAERNNKTQVNKTAPYQGVPQNLTLPVESNQGNKMPPQLYKNLASSRSLFGKGNKQR
mmetsp:Transcript_18210/g.31159  ORF Transcript_18210/g.31159 Transcript_18210/m.31159 type:complete len:100 (-) Transcript_18210:198-497(-)